MTRLRAHPWHLLIAAGTFGMLAGPRLPLAGVLLLALAAAALPVGSRVRVACAVLVLVGAAWAQARLAALDRPGRAPPVGVFPLLATLDEAPRATAFGWRAFARDADGRLLVRGRGARPHAWPGDVLRLAGRFHTPGQREGWLRARHVTRVLDARFARRAGTRRGGFSGTIDGIRRRAATTLGARLPPPEGALLRGMTLGDDAALPLADRDALRAAGLGHLVAASGQNVALLVLLVQALGIVTGIGRHTRLLLALALIAAYVPLAGGGPSIQRAGVMGAAAIVAALAARPAARWHALLLAALVTLALDPAAPAQPGWALSFAAVVAIALLCAPLAATLVRRRVPAPLAPAIAMTLAATIGTAPVGAAFFGSVSLAGPLANVLVAPLVAPITWAGMLASLLGQAWPPGGAALAALAGPALACVLEIAAALASAGPAQVAVSVPLTALVSVGAGLLVVPAARMRVRATLSSALRACRDERELPRAGHATRRARLLRPGSIAAGVAILAALLIVAWPALDRGAPRATALASGTLRISFLDVGQGDATLLQAAGAALLVDTGPPRGPVLHRLREAGVRRLDGLVATHAQADHLGAAAAILRKLSVGLLVDGRDGVGERHGSAMAAAARVRGVRIAAPRAGDRLRVGDLRADVLWPPPRRPGAAPVDDPNDRAVVLLVRAGGVRVLLTADAESGVLERLSLPQVDVLKVSHHGSADPGLPALLRRLRPRVAVIQVGAENTYGHPVPATVEALRAAGARVLRTDRDGSVVLEARAGRLMLRTRR